MKEKIVNEISSRSFKTFLAMLLIFALIIPCLNGMSIKVHAADTAQVWKLYGEYTENGPVVHDVLPDSEPTNNQNQIGKLVKGGTYTLTNDDRDTLIIADNAEVTAGDIFVADVKLSGTSSIIYTDYTLSSTPDRFAPYPATAGAITVEGIHDHYERNGTPYYTNKIDDWPDPYDLTVTGNMVIAGRPNQDDKGNSWLEPNWIGYNDIRVLNGGHISIEELGYFLVEHSLTVESGGSITGSGDHYIRVCRDSRVTGLPLYSGPNTDDVTAYFDTDSRTNNYADYEFVYDSAASKWICPIDTTAPVFFFYVGGFDPDHESIAVQYENSTGSYEDVVPTCTGHEDDTTNYAISLRNLAPDATTVKLKITFSPAANSNKIMACWAPRTDETNIQFNGISSSGKVLERTFSLDDGITISLNYPNAGLPGIIDTTNNYLYAYAGADEATIKHYLATELYNRFIEVAMYEDFGLKRISAPADRITELASRITAEGSPYTISVAGISGPVEIPVQDYKISWGNNIENGSPISGTIPVYTLPDENSFLICTDFNKENGPGRTFYIRKAHADEIDFYDNGYSAIRIFVPSINPKTIVIGGMGADTTVLNTDNIFAFDLNSRWLNADVNGPSQTGDPAGYGTKVRLMLASETYVLLEGVGETANYGNVGNNGFGTDPVWNTRDDGTAEAMVYIGHDELYLKPLAAETGVSVYEITEVKLADDSLSVGVHITPLDTGKTKITFDSNFYSSIPLIITYSGGTTRKLTINRVGLVIQYQFLGGSPNKDTDVPDHLEMKFDHTNATTDLFYDYFAGEQIAIFGIYYTPSNDPTGNHSDLSLYLTYENGTHRVITSRNDDELEMADGSIVPRGFNGKLQIPGRDNSVETTVFLIGFAQARQSFDRKGNIWVGNITETYVDAFYANVLNAGWDDDDNFGGTQVGSGKGIYWNGHITWY